MKKHIGLVLAACLWGLPLVPGGCASDDIRNAPEYALAAGDLAGVREVLKDGIQAGDAEKIAELLALFDQHSAELERKLADKEADIRATVNTVKDTGKPFVPSPFDKLIDPAAVAAIAFWLSRLHKGAVKKLKDEAESYRNQVSA